jgi:hypothetical protein
MTWLPTQISTHGFPCCRYVSVRGVGRPDGWQTGSQWFQLALQSRSSPEVNGSAYFGGIFISCIWEWIGGGGRRNCSYRWALFISKVAGIATAYGLDDRGVRFRSPSWVKYFLLSTSFRPALGPTQPPIQGLPGVRRPGSEADDSPASPVVKSA